MKIFVLYPLQFGFRPGHPVDMALINTHELVSKPVDENKYSIGIFPDLAFDTGKRIEKKYIVRGLLLQRFKSYLTERYMYKQAQCNGNLYDLKVIKYDVTQGSNLFPIIFLL